MHETFVLLYVSQEEVMLLSLVQLKACISQLFGGWICFSDVMRGVGRSDGIFWEAKGAFLGDLKFGPRFQAIFRLLEWSCWPIFLHLVKHFFNRIEDKGFLSKTPWLLRIRTPPSFFVYAVIFAGLAFGGICQKSRQNWKGASFAVDLWLVSKSTPCCPAESGTQWMRLGDWSSVIMGCLCERNETTWLACLWEKTSKKRSDHCKATNPGRFYWLQFASVLNSFYLFANLPFYWTYFWKLLLL